jgi:hypothetical protein
MELILFDVYIHIFFHTLNALQCGHPVSLGEHPVEIPILTYLDVLEQFVVPQVEDLQPTVIFQHDGAPPHWGRIVRDYLDATFSNRWLGRDGPQLGLPDPLTLHL